MSAPAAASSSGVRVFTAAWVPTGMKAGVNTSPCRVAMRPARACVSGSCASSVKFRAIQGRAGLHPARRPSLGARGAERQGGPAPCAWRAFPLARPAAQRHPQPMLAPAAAFLLLAAAAEARPAPPDSAAADSSSRRVVTRMEEIVVRASRLADPFSSQSVHLVTREALRELPVDDLADVLSLQAGVVATGEDLHVRGGRAGDAQLLLQGIPLGEALRGRPMELPQLAIESADVVSGGLDAEFGGALAGVIPLRTVSAGERPSGELRWDGDFGYR